LGTTVTGVEPLTGGTQNVVVRLQVDGRPMVLRRPPVHPRPTSDKTMLREIAALRTLAGTPVPHPGFIAGCDDLDVIGVVFYLMEEVDGFNPGDSMDEAYVRNPDWRLPGSDLRRDILDAAGADHVDFIPATRLATALCGDTIASNMFLLGYAWQKGWLPLAAGSLEKAIELNGVSVQTNQAAFLWGRRAAHDPERVKKIAFPAQVIALKPAATLDDIIARRADFLADYQNASYAARYRALVEKVRAAETALVSRDGNAPKLPLSFPLSEAVARNYFKLLAIKDEYEVARLHTRPEFLARIREQFEGDYRLKFHLAPPTLAKPDASGQVQKREYGPWMLTVFRLLASLRFLRGTALDPFRGSEDRKLERRLLVEYERNMEELVACLTVQNHSLAVDIASIPEDIRGYGRIRAKSALVAKQKEEKLLAQLRAPAAAHERAA